jgi:hypothetical protein
MAPSRFEDFHSKVAFATGVDPALPVLELSPWYVVHPPEDTFPLLVVLLVELLVVLCPELELRVEGPPPVDESR